MRIIKGVVAIAALSLAPALANAGPKTIQPTAYQQSSTVQTLLPGSFEYQAGG